MTEAEDASTAGDAGREIATFGEAARRLAAVLFQPAKTFAAIAHLPTWGLALLLLCSTTLVVKFLVEPRISPESLRAFLEDRGVPAENIDEAVEQQLSPAPGARFISAVSAFGGAGLFYVVTAAIFLALARLMGSEIDFRRSLAVATHGLLPFAVATLVVIPVILSRPSIDFQETFAGNFLASHAGVFAGDDTGARWRALLSSIDLFSVWCIALLTIGFRVVGKLSRGAALAVVLVPWLVAVLIKVGVAGFLGG